MVEITSSNIETINLTFLNKIKDYISIMKNFVGPEEIENRKDIICSEFQLLMDTYVKSNDNDTKNKIDSIINNEIGFLNFFTTNIDNKEEHGLNYKNSNGNVLYSGITDALTYSTIRTLGLLKESKGEEFNFPKELDEEIVRYYQIKDRLTLDLMDLFKDKIMSDFFLGKGKDFNLDMQHIFLMEASTKTDEIEKITSSGKKSVDDAVIEISARNLKEFDDGVNNSIKYNNEDYYNKYISKISYFKELSKDINWTKSDEIVEKTHKGLK